MWFMTEPSVLPSQYQLRDEEQQVRVWRHWLSWNVQTLRFEIEDLCTDVLAIHILCKRSHCRWFSSLRHLLFQTQFQSGNLGVDSREETSDKNQWILLLGTWMATKWKHYYLESSLTTPSWLACNNHSYRIRFENVCYKFYFKPSQRVFASSQHICTHNTERVKEGDLSLIISAILLPKLIIVSRMVFAMLFYLRL